MGILKRLFKRKSKYLTADDARKIREDYLSNNEYKEVVRNKIYEGECRIRAAKDNNHTELIFSFSELDTIMDIVAKHFENKGFIVQYDNPYLIIRW